MARLLAERGHAAFCINTRGHDWISPSTIRPSPSSVTPLSGSTYENFEDCLPDLDAALSCLSERGHRRFVLMGHSMGAAKCIYYQATRQRTDVAGIVTCSCPERSLASRPEGRSDFFDHLARAQALLAEGRGEKLLWASPGRAFGLYTARTFVSKYGREEINNPLPHAARLDRPLLAIAGSREGPALADQARRLAEAVGPGRGSSHVFDGAGHYYRSHEPALADHIAAWLAHLAI